MQIQTFRNLLAHKMSQWRFEREIGARESPMIQATGGLGDGQGTFGGKENGGENARK